LFAACRDSLERAAAALLRRAQDEGSFREDLAVGDLMAFAHTIALVAGHSEQGVARAARPLDLLVAGLRRRSRPSRVIDPAVEGLKGIQQNTGKQPPDAEWDVRGGHVKGEIETVNELGVVMLHAQKPGASARETSEETPPGPPVRRSAPDEARAPTGEPPPTRAYQALAARERRLWSLSERLTNTRFPGPVRRS
jgi:transcriptional regulator SbtR-like protein